MIQIDIPMPTNCRYCPCISGYSRRCTAVERSFTNEEMCKQLNHMRDGYRPKWCPLKEVEK